MRRRENIVITFVLIAFVLLLVIFFQKPLEPVTGLLEKILTPFQGAALSIIKAPSNLFSNQKVLDLTEENRKLLQQSVDVSKLKDDNQALRDQFEVTQVSSQKLLPAQIIGMPQFIPGISVPDEIIINKGTSDSVQKGEAVLYKNILLGIVSSSSLHVSKVSLLTQKDFSTTALALGTGALGVLKGEGGGDMVLDNVLLSDTLKIGDLVKAKGDVNDKGIGVPPDLLIGKIISIDKKASNLFQSAKIKNLADVTRLSLVFVLLP